MEIAGDQLSPFGLVLYARHAQGNATEIARQLGVERMTVWRWARGVRPVPVEHLDRLAELLDVPRERLEEAA